MHAGPLNGKRHAVAGRASVLDMSLPNPLHRPYPPDVYTGEHGEASAWLRPDATGPDLTHSRGGSCE